MATSNPITVQDFIDTGLPEALTQIANEAKIPLEQMKESILKMAPAIRTMSQSLPENEAQLKIWQATLKTCTKGSQDYLLAQKQINDIVRANKEVIAGSTSAYKAYSIENERLRQAAKDLAIQYGVTSEAAMNATAAFNEHDAKIRAVDQSMNNFSRNVGNYSNSFSSSLRPISQLLRGLGYTLGIPIVGLREYSALLSGASALHEKFGGSIKAVTIADKDNTAALLSLQAAGLSDAEAMEVLTATNLEVGASFLAMLGPVAVIIGAIVGLIAIMELVIGAHHRSMEAQKEYSKAMDGTVIVNKKERDSYNETIVELGKLSDAYDVLTGKITTYQAAINDNNRTAKKDIADMENERLNALHDLDSGLGGTAHSIWEGIKDLATGKGVGTHLAQQKLNINREYFGNPNIPDDNGLEGNKQTTTDAANKEKIAEGAEALRKAQDETKKTTLENMQEIETERISLIKGNQRREEQEVENTRKYDTAKLQVDIDYLEDRKKLNGKLTDEENEKYKQLTDKRTEIQKIALLQQEGLTVKYNLLENQEQLEANEKAAALTGNKFAEENAAYDSSKNQLIDNLTERYGKEYLLQDESQKELENLKKKHVQTMRDITNGQTQEELTAEDKFNATIENKQLREQMQLLSNTKKFKQSQIEYLEKNGGLTAETAYSPTAQNAAYNNLSDSQKNTYNTNESANKAAAANSQFEIDAQNRQITDTNAAQSSGEAARHDAAMGLGSAGGKGLQKLTTEKLDAQQDAYQKEYDALKDSFGNEANLTAEQQDALNQLTQKNADIQTEIKHDAAVKQAEFEKEKTEEELQAIENSLKIQNEKVQQQLAAQQEMYASDADIQATLAGEGRKNSLAAVQKAQAQVEAQQQAAARKAAEQQEAIELVKLVETLQVEYVKGGMDGPAALAKAMQQALLTKAATAGLMAAFYEGTPDTGNGGNMDSKGGFLAMLHPKEAVIPADRNKEAPGLAKAWIDGDIDKWAMETYFPKMNLQVGASEYAQLAIISAKLDKLNDVKEAIENQPFLEPVFENESMAVRKITKNGNTETIIHHKHIRLQKPHAGI